MKTDSRIIISVMEKIPGTEIARKEIISAFGLLNSFAAQLKFKINLRTDEYLCCRAYPVSQVIDESLEEMVSFPATVTVHQRLADSRVGKLLATTHHHYVNQESGEYSHGVCIFKKEIFYHHYDSKRCGDNAIDISEKNLLLFMAKRLINSYERKTGKNRGVKDEIRYANFFEY